MLLASAPKSQGENIQKGRDGKTSLKQVLRVVDWTVCVKCKIKTQS